MGKLVKKKRKTEGLATNRVADLSYLYPDIPENFKFNGTPLWEQQPGEDPLNFFYFQIYRDLGPSRSVLQARIHGMRLAEYEERNYKKYAPAEHKRIKKLLRHHTVTDKIARNWGWKDRARAYDDYVEWKCRFLADNPLEARRNELKTIQEIRFKALQVVQQTPLHKIPLNTAISLLQLTHQHELALRGKPNVRFDFGESASDNDSDSEFDDDEDFEELKEMDWSKVPSDLIEQIIEHGTGKVKKAETAIVVKPNGNGKTNGSSRQT